MSVSEVVRWRYFLAHQDSKQEAWLQEQARRGFHLVRPGLFRFCFTRAEPRTDKYRLDFQTLTGARRSEYLAIFADAGWEFLGQVATRYYFRARPDAFSPEIFTDPESKKARIRRQMRSAAIITGLLAFQLSMGLNQLFSGFAKTPPPPVAVPILSIALTATAVAFGVWCIWQMEQAYKKQR